MNLTTVTYDADKYQLMPKELTEQMLFNVQGRIPVTFSDYRQIYSRWLVNAPQPETLSPWLPIEALTKGDGDVLLKWDDGCVRIGERWDSAFKGFICRLDFGDITTSVWVPKDYLPIEWMPLPKPEQGK
jgi:hypothetical protein